MTGVRTEGTEQLEQIGARLKEASDRKLTNNVRASLRMIGKPLGESVLRRGAEQMPKRGGLADRVATRGKVGLSTALVSKTVRVAVLLRNDGVRMKELDAGRVRHPVFGNRKVWRSESVSAGAFTRAFYEEAPVASRAALSAAQSTLDGVARGF